MAITLRLTEEERDDLRAVTAAKGVSMQDAAQQAIREFVVRSGHRDRFVTPDCLGRPSQDPKPHLLQRCLSISDGKAAALLQSIVSNHALVDGNK